MKFNPVSVRTLFLLAVWAGAVRPARADPKIFWASTPVRPDETVLLQGSDLGGPGAIVEIARLGDSGKESEVPVSSKSQQWIRVSVLQAGAESLKFVVPATWQMGVFACRVTSKGAVTEPTLINAPEPWWVQGDEGEAATPGGWLRVLGKSLSIEGSVARLAPAKGESIVLRAKAADSYSLLFELPHDLAPGAYTVLVHNGCGGESGWRSAGQLSIAPPPAPPTRVFSVLEFYGPSAAQEIRKSLIKYNEPQDRTEGIQAALKHARENGGGVVYFPAGRYAVKGILVVPDHTILRGEGMGIVTLWWGTGPFNLDGGGAKGRVPADEPKPPQILISGSDFGIENMSLYLPLEYETGISAQTRFRMQNVRVRIDHYWTFNGRGGGVVARLGRNFQVTDCDILAKGTALMPGEYGTIARNTIRANRANTPLGNSRQVIVENNHFISMDPTAYQNISGVGRNLYYAHNLQECLYAHQGDYSFTFDQGTGAYFGKLEETRGTDLTLAADPVYPKWADEKSGLWRQAAICILDGRGAGQWRDLASGHGRLWQIDRPFDTMPDATSIVTIVPFNGRVLVISNRFEDANWVNAGYGTSIDVVCAENVLARCADLMNYSLAGRGVLQPSWYVQYLDNRISEGLTEVGSSGTGHKSDQYSGPLTCWCIHRRETLTSDNSGSIAISGNVYEAIVEGCRLQNPQSTIRVQGQPQDVLLRNNLFEGGSPRYEGDSLKSALIEPPYAVSRKP
jgi:hypothetical protein